MVVKLNAMRATITMKFTSSKPTNAIIGDIHNLLTTIFKGEAPTREEWSIVLMLNALNRTDFNWLRKNLIMQFSNAKMKPLEKEVIKTINLAGYNNLKHIEQAHAFKPSSGAKKPKCKICNNSHHSFEGCWAKGGGAEGQAPDWWKEMQKKKLGNSKAKSKSSKDKVNAEKDDDSSNSHTEKVGAAITEDNFSE
jgi:hypothetical protein